MLKLSCPQQTTGADSAYFLTDALGSTRALSDSTAAVTDTFTYDAYGGLYSDDPFADFSTTATPYLFTGHRHDSALGLYHARARVYDPGVGRFLSRDTWPVDYANPIELNRYAYVAGNPVNAVDPSGLFLERISLDQVRTFATSALAFLGTTKGKFSLFFLYAVYLYTVNNLIYPSFNLPSSSDVLGISEFGGVQEFRNWLEELASQLGQGTRTRVRTQERQDDDDNRILVAHYTSQANAESILATRSINPSASIREAHVYVFTTRIDDTRIVAAAGAVHTQARVMFKVPPNDLETDPGIPDNFRRTYSAYTQYVKRFWRPGIVLISDEFACIEYVNSIFGFQSWYRCRP